MRRLRYLVLGLLCGLVILAAQSFVLTPFRAQSGTCAIPLTKVYPNPDMHYGMPTPEPPRGGFAIKEIDPPAPACDELTREQAAVIVEHLKDYGMPRLNQPGKFLIPKLGPLTVPEK